MRNLIRLFLLTIARMALLATVLVWIMSNWLSIWSSAGDLAGVIAQDEGWSVGCPGQSVWALVTYDVERLDYADKLFRPSAPDDPVAVKQIIPGFFVLSNTTPSGQSWYGLAIRHWLATLVAVVFYVALKLIYRKRPEQRVRESTAV